ncbi:proline-rich receptor-like protein kinase PERK8 [Helianthus annuus]|uniref:proline-rich receptor-like protein kinase PERK8 n=1 Tax=Helianthus annuus TaxID=4232 RepID=UPI000B903D25|nr:proline-rich receptor-like protein kinase PERK8 [Helianthus annuus]
MITGHFLEDLLERQGKLLVALASAAFGSVFAVFVKLCDFCTPTPPPSSTILHPPPYTHTTVSPPPSYTHNHHHHTPTNTVHPHHHLPSTTVHPHHHFSSTTVTTVSPPPYTPAPPPYTQTNVSPPPPLLLLRPPQQHSSKPATTAEPVVPFLRETEKDERNGGKDMVWWCVLGFLR